MTECKRCLTTTDMRVKFDSKGICSYCHMHDELEKKYPKSKAKLRRAMKQIKDDNVNEDRWDCIFGISGGVDSSLVLHTLKEHGVNPLVYHWDNGWNTPEAEENIRAMVEGTGFDFITFHATDEYHQLNKVFLKASVNDADIPNDIAMMRISFDLAKTNNIKWIVNGHSFRTESSCPVYWTLLDSDYLNDLYETFTESKLHRYPLFPWSYQLKNAFSGIKQVRPIYWMDYDRNETKTMLRKKYGWKDYGTNHAENVYTAFIGYWLLPNKFGIDKRKLYLSAKIRSGIITKKQAKRLLKEKVQYDDNYTDRVIEEYFGGNEKLFNQIIAQKPHHFYDYGDYMYKFTVMKPLLWIFMKLKMFPETFYKKYTTEMKLIKEMK